MKNEEGDYVRLNFPEPYLVAGDKPTPSEQRNINVIADVMEKFWLHKDASVGSRLFAPGCIRHDCLMPEVIGPERYSEMVVKYHKAFAFEEFDLQILLAEANWVAWRTTVIGRHVGEFFGLKPTGTKLTIVTQTLVKFNEDNLVIEGWVLTDYLTLALDLFRAQPWYRQIFGAYGLYKTVLKLRLEKIAWDEKVNKLKSDG